MLKEQILIIKVRYEDEQDKAPHMWNWDDMVSKGHGVEIINHGQPETVRQE